MAKNLPALDRAVREVVVLAADLPDEAMPRLELAYEYHTGDERVDKEATDPGGGRASTAAGLPAP